MAEFPSLQSTGPSSLQVGGESLPQLTDKEPEFVNASDTDRFKCTLHNGMLVEPQQTKCGHRFCSRCIQTYLAGVDKKPCPMGEPDCEDVSKKEVWRDNSIIRDIKEAQVWCHNKPQGCTTKTRFRSLKDHLVDCPFEPVACVYASRGCHERPARGKMGPHRSVCPCRPVRCDFCENEINYVNLQTHRDSECGEARVGCPFGCGDKKLKRKEVESHKATCPVQPVDCKFKSMGCNFSNKREEVARHEKEDLDKHLELLTLKVASLEMTGMTLQGKIQEMTVERENIQRNLQSLSQEPGGQQPSVPLLEGQLRDIKLKMVTVLEKAFTLERKIPELAENTRVQALEQNLTRMQQQVRELESNREREQQQRSSSGGVGGGVGGGGVSAGGAVGSGSGRYNNVNDMASSFSTRLENHDQQLSVHDIRMAEMDLRFQLLETASYDGRLIWKIRDYERRKRDAVCGRTLSLYSQPFYTNRFGYKMCARVYLNGDGMGKTTHLSLFFVIMRGEYDALLVWPFRQKVTLTLLDQSPEKRHLTDSFQPDPSSTSFQRPVSEMNVASGCPLFVSHSVLENQSNGYLRDDTIFIRIIVEDSPSSSPF